MDKQRMDKGIDGGTGGRSGAQAAGGLRGRIEMCKVFTKY